MFLQLTFWCWYIFVFFWLINIFANKRTVKRETVGSRLRYQLLFFLGFWLLFGSASSRRHYPLNFVVFPHSAGLAIAGFLITASGLGLALWARVILGKNWSGTVTVKENHELIQKGPYAYVRHPIYSAMLLMFVGTALGLGVLGSLLSVPILFLSFWIKYRQEEAFMIKQFGDTYREYRKRVRAVVPFIF